MKLSVADAARLLETSEQEVYQWIRARGLPHVKIQDQCLIHPTSLHEWALARRVPLRADVFRESPGDGGDGDLAQALRRGGVHRFATPTDAQDAARRLVAALPLSEGCRQAVSQVVAARPDLGLASGGDGVALPRATEPLLAAGRPAILLFALDTPWVLGRTSLFRVFVVVAPTVGLHQRLVAELDSALHQPEFRAATLRADDAASLADLASRAQPMLAAAK